MGFEIPTTVSLLRALLPGLGESGERIEAHRDQSGILDDIFFDRGYYASLKHEMRKENEAEEKEATQFCIPARD